MGDWFIGAALLPDINIKSIHSDIKPIFHYSTLGQKTKPYIKLLAPRTNVCMQIAMQVI